MFDDILFYSGDIRDQAAKFYEIFPTKVLFVKLSNSELTRYDATSITGPILR